MIVREQFRRAGGLAEHLARLDTNKSVTLRADLGRGLPVDIKQALVVLAGISRTNPRTKRHFIHFKISPAKTDERSIQRALALIEKEYGIDSRSPRLVVEHEKGDRPNHFHVVYSVVDLSTGRAVSSEGNYLKDETISRLLELELGEAITPGPRHVEVVEILRERDQVVEAAALAGVEAARPGARLRSTTRRQLERVGVDADAAGAQIYQLWNDVDGEREAFRRRLGEAGFDIVMGHSVLVALHRVSGGEIPLRRILNEHSKAAGMPLGLVKQSFDDLFEDSETLDLIKGERRRPHITAARAATDQELLRLGREALVDGDPVQAAKAYGALAARRAQHEVDLRRAHKEAEAEIRREKTRLVSVRRQRVERAFRAAAIFDARRMRQIAFGAAAAGALLAGGGLGVALLAGGFAVGLLPTYETARALARQARLDRKSNSKPVKAAVNNNSAESSSQVPLFKSRDDHRVAAVYFDLVLAAQRRRLTSREASVAKAARQVLRPITAATVGMLAKRRDANVIRRQLRLHTPVAHGDRCDVARVFRSQGHRTVADGLDPTTALIMQVVANAQARPDEQEVVEAKHDVRGRDRGR
ncbi:MULTISPECIES: relaxase/mobilization nuclease domain-containing protein [Bosea]|jgi:hypothetical protein|uniref:MobA/VirD2-like nuclease domain-containing protein n=1 Tax=Bosea vaviloviae TaxID=1526658 RepID=A0A0N1FEN1_9HYPH|nr:hypothetical protein [Bosea vaviloviae]KPH80807.1 hypothetical protein AE618_11300 [Bosea vaviloviae]